MLIKVAGKSFAAGLTWLDAQSRRTVSKQARLVKAKYGVFLPKQGIAGFAGKAHQRLQALAPMIASRIELGVAFIALDAIGGNEAKYLFVAAKSYRLLPSLKVGERVVSGDIILSEQDAKCVLEQLGDMPIFGYQSEAILSGIEYTALPDHHFALKRGKAFLVKKLSHGGAIYLSLAVLWLLVGAVALQVMMNHPELSKLDLIKFEKEVNILAKKHHHEWVLAQGNAQYVMQNLSALERKIPLFTQGFRLTHLRYVTERPGYPLQLTYALIPLGNITHMSSLFDVLGARGIKYKASTMMLNGTQVVIDAGIKDLEPNELGSLGESKANLGAFLGALQRYEIPYQVIIQKAHSAGSTQVIFSHLDAYGFDRLYGVVNSFPDPHLTINTASLAVSKNGKLAWSIKGQYHA